MEYFVCNSARTTYVQVDVAQCFQYNFLKVLYYTHFRIFIFFFLSQTGAGSHNWLRNSMDLQKIASLALCLQLEKTLSFSFLLKPLISNLKFQHQVGFSDDVVVNSENLTSELQWNAQQGHRKGGDRVIGWGQHYLG